MRRIDLRTLFGGSLILLGVLMLLEKIGILRGASDLFWGFAMLVASGYFMVMFANNPQVRWWAIIPAMTLLGMAGSVLLPRLLSGFGGSFFLAALGAAFFIVYFSDRTRWWGIIPGGVLMTLAVVAGIDKMEWVNSGSIFFVGLGLTFLLVAILPNPSGKMQWAYIPSLVLVIMGALLGTRSTAALADFVWPATLIIIGLVLLVSFFFNKQA